MHLLLLFILCFYNINYSQDFSFQELKIGMTQEEIITTIKNSQDLILSEDYLLKQVLLPTPKILVLKSTYSNNNIIQKVFIDFEDNKSYQITIFLNPIQFSYYTLSENMLNKYGVPIFQNSYKTVWEDQANQKRATLEYPNIIKFVDIAVLSTIIQKQDNTDLTNYDSSLIKERQRILNDL